VQISECSAVITGGGSGLGEATARELATHGARVALLDLPSSNGEAVAKELGRAAIYCPTDVSDGAQVEAAIERVVGELGGIHIAVNCAGIGTAGRTISRDGPHDLADFERTIRVNLIGTFNVVRFAANAMSKNELSDSGERGVLVNTASAAAFEGQIGQAAYSASKGGIVGMTLPIARDLASLAIRNVTIAPGLFGTPMMSGVSGDQKSALESTLTFPQRFGRPEEYAALVVSIVTNPMLNGETIRLDGAYRLPPRW